MGQQRVQDGGELLGLFAKFWEPGAVKTRLAASLGNAAASSLYRQFVITLLTRFRDVADCRQLAYWPPQQMQAFVSLAGEHWEVCPQINGDLGRRMSHFFEGAFSGGARRVVLIGSDSPTLPRNHIAQAFESLKKYPLVLGSTPDGGYYLIGATPPVPRIFDHISWSSASVWDETVALIDRENLTFTELPEWFDVDELDDLTRLRKELTQHDATDFTSQELLQAVDSVL